MAYYKRPKRKANRSDYRRKVTHSRLESGAVPRQRNGGGAASRQRIDGGTASRPRNQRNQRSVAAVRKAKKSNAKVLLLTIGVPIAVILVFAVCFIAQYEEPVVSTERVTVSIGGELPEPTAWFTKLKGKAVYKKKDVDTNVLGAHKVAIRAGFKSYSATLYVVDDIAPTAKPVNVAVAVGAELSPEDFCRDSFDHSSFTAAFENPPDVSQAGIYNVTVRLTDEHRNFSYVDAVCEVFSVEKKVIFVQGGGKQLQIADFTSLTDISNCRFIDTPPSDFSEELGEYGVTLSINGEEYQSKAVVVENEPPSVSAKAAEIFLGETAQSSDFYTIDEDKHEAEDISSEFVTVPDWTKAGNQEVTVRVVDEIGNYRNVTATLTVIEDTNAPVIAAEEVYSTLGASIKYRTGVTIEDDYDKKPKLAIDSSKVDINQAGDYEVTYTATDRGHNSSSITVAVHVLPISQEILEEIADDKLQELGVFDETDKLEQIKIIHRYLLNNVVFLRNLAYQDDDKIMLYTGLMTMQGDCTISQRIAELFLSRIGVETKRIINIHDKHEWNLIKLNGLWYHFDATQYYDGVTDTYLFTNKRALELSGTDARWQRYFYNEANYPTVE